MKGQDIIREAMELNGMSQQALADKVGFKRQTNVSECLRSRNMRLDSFLRMLNAMDCDVIVRSRKEYGSIGTEEKYVPMWTVTMEEGAEEGKVGRNGE